MADEIWTRRENETSVAHDAFKTYLYQGKDRSHANVAEAVGKSVQLMNRWAAAHDWRARSVAYDRYIAAADTDGMVHALAESRDKNLALMDKLRGLLDACLDGHIAKVEPPTIRWTQACMAMAKIEANSLLLGKEDKTSEKVETIMAMMEKVAELQNRMPERP
jgi:hypothetical protein